MKPVIQQEPTGCAIAAAAALAGISYRRSKAKANALGMYADDPLLWSETAPIRYLLAILDIATTDGEHPFTTWEALPDRALLALKWHLEGGRPYWHWAVFVREGEECYVLDSKKGLKHNRRTDFGRMKPKWYIEVER